jgi:RNA polymerase sigma factor (sigma-70 family)
MNILFLKNKYSDNDIVNHISKGTKEEELCLRQLYKDNVKSILSFVLKNNGEEEDGKEVLQNAIIVLYEKIKKGNFELKAKLSTYLFSVAKNQWYGELKKQNRYMSIVDGTEDVVFGSSFQEEDVLEEDDNKKALVIAIMNQLKTDCKEILVYSVYQNYSMTEIAEIMGFKNEQIARNKKSKCLGYFKNLILKSPKADKLMNVLAS